MPRLFGFERLMAPYAIAHLHLSTVLAGQDLDDTMRVSLGVDLDAMTAADGSPSRLGVYLTNTLEEPVTSHEVLSASFVGREAEQAAHIKRDLPIMVVVGNPPYRARSTNPSFREEPYRDRLGVERRRRVNTWIGDQVDEYKHVVVRDNAGREVRVGLGERNAQSLNDDYVKFIRFAEWRIERTGQGVLGFVTNHGYLDNPTFRGMRQHLLRTFTDLYVLDLGGNPVRNVGRNDPDDNVFDIRDAGVAIALFVKRPGVDDSAGNVHHHAVRGTRAAKEEYLTAHDVTNTAWVTLSPSEPAFLFVPQREDTRVEWSSYVSVMDLFTLNGPGIKSGRDALTMHTSADEAWEAAVAFATLPEAAARERWRLGSISEESRGWTYQTARADLRAALLRAGYDPDRPTPQGAAAARNALIRAVAYRPFDVRWTIWTGTTQGFIAWPSTNAMNHYLSADSAAMNVNVGLVTARQNASGNADHFWVARLPTEMKTAESTRGSLNLPLYRYSGFQSTDGHQLDVTATDGSQARATTLKLQYGSDIAQRTGLTYQDDGSGDLLSTLGPEDVLAYTYAVLNSETYRTRYAQQLRSEHPRVPLPTTKDLFVSLARLGHRLIQLHTDDQINPPDVRAVNFPQRGTGRVERLTSTTKPPRWTSPGYTLPHGGTATRGRLWLQPHPRPADGPDRQPAQYVDGVEEDVWRFTVGGHQVLNKWLRAREGRLLSIDELTYLRRTIAAIAATLAVRQQIDQPATSLLEGAGTDDAPAASGAD